MTEQLSSPIHRFRAVLLRAGVREHEVIRNGGSVVGLSSVQGHYDAWTWIDHLPFAAADELLPVGDVCTLSIDHAGASSLVLTQFALQEADLALDHVSPLACPVAGEVGETRRLIASIHCTEIRDFVAEALSVEAAYRWFWTCPASLSHHHAYPGGLARHSREVAERAALAVGDKPLQRDIAIAYGLLHDYGKIWSYENGGLSRAAQRLGHEQLGYEKMMAPIQRLRARFDEGGYIIQSLLSGAWKRDGHPPIAAVGNIVRSLDQFSAEEDRVPHGPARPWRANHHSAGARIA
jgi:Putative helicase